MIYDSNGNEVLEDMKELTVEGINFAIEKLTMIDTLENKGLYNAISIALRALISKRDQIVSKFLSERELRI